MSSTAPTKRNTTFKGDVLRLVSGTSLAQVISLLAAPLLTRLYAPDAYGVAALFVSITGILGILACLRYELSIVLPDNDRDAANLLAVSLGSTLFISILTIPIIGYGGGHILAWVNMPELAPFLWLIPVVVFMHGIFTALNYWNTRTKHFTRLSIARVTSQLTGTGSSLSLGLTGYTTGGSLIAASLGGQIVATTILGSQVWRDNGRFIFGCITGREMWACMKRHRNFPLYSSWGALINNASWQIPILLLGTFFSPAVVGLYSLGLRVVQMPLSLIAGAISQVFFQRGTVARTSGELGRLVEGLYRRMLILGLLPSMILMLFGADLFTIVFGPEWHEAGVFTQILAPWAFVWFLSSPLSTIYAIQEEQKKEFIIHGIIFLTRITAISVGGLVGSPRIAIFLFSLGGVIAYGYLLYKIFFFAGLNGVNQIKYFFSQLTEGIIYLMPVIILHNVNQAGEHWVILLSALMLGIYYYHKKSLILA